jgi:hypothetical protein
MKDSQVLSPSRRPLTETERRVLRAKIRSLTARGRRASVAALPVTGGIVVVLWLWTVLASDVNWVIVTAFWLIVGAGIALWVRRDMRSHGRDFETMSRGLESALRRNAADVYDVRARLFAELEEIEDEGACYAFELDDGRIAFIQGQEFYDGARFPSLDFSLVYILDEAGQTVDMLLDKRGAKAIPARRIPAAVKQRLDVPDHLEVRTGRIADLENILATSSPRA